MLLRKGLYLQAAPEMTVRCLLPSDAGSVGGLQGCGEPKRLETEAATGQQLSSLNLSSPFDLNFPLPGEKGPACLVKVSFRTYLNDTSVAEDQNPVLFLLYLYWVSPIGRFDSY